MGFWRTRDREGRARPGPGLPILAAAAGGIIAFVLLWKPLPDDRDRLAREQAARRDVNVEVAELVEAARGFQPVAEPPPERAAVERSLRLADVTAPRDAAASGAPGAGSASALERAFAALIDRASRDGARTGPPPGPSGKAPQPPAPPVQILYRKPSEQAPGAAPAAPQTSGAPRPASSRSPFLPYGHKIPVFFLETVRTLDIDGIVELGVSENVSFNHRVVLPFGVRLYGRAGNRNPREKVPVQVDRLLFPDGRTLSVRGIAKDTDGSSGVTGILVAEPTLVRIQPYAGAFASAYLRNLAQRSRSPVPGLDGGGFSPRDQALDEASRALGDYLREEQRTLRERHPAHVVVPAGTAALVQLLDELVIDP